MATKFEKLANRFYLPRPHLAVTAHLIRLIRLPRQRLLLLPEAMVALMSAAFRVRRASFQRLARHLGTQGLITPTSISSADAATVRDVEWAIAALCRRAPRKPTCLMQAAAAQMLLRRRRIPATIYLGVTGERPEDGRTFNAHAWLRCGDRIVTGKAEAARFKPIAWFAPEKL